MQLGPKHNLTVGNCDAPTVEKLVDMLEEHGIINRDDGGER